MYYFVDSSLASSRRREDARFDAYRQVLLASGSRPDRTGNRSPGRIIVADDDPALRGLLVRVLQGDGHSVVVLRDGEELVERIHTSIVPELAMGRHSLLISDVHMPRRSGLEALEILRAKDWSTPAILMTGGADAHICAAALQLGAAALLPKPVHLDELRHLVLQLLADLDDGLPLAAKG